MHLGGIQIALVLHNKEATKRRGVVVMAVLVVREVEISAVPLLDRIALHTCFHSEDSERELCYQVSMMMPPLPAYSQVIMFSASTC